MAARSQAFAIVSLLLAASQLSCAASAFSPHPEPSVTSRRRHKVAPLRASSTTDSSSNVQGDGRPRLLASAFPRDLPAGMRGEAVRAALRSSNGVCIDFTPSMSNNDDDQLCVGVGVGVGVVKVVGRGVRPFLEGKLSNSFGLGDGGAATVTKAGGAASHHTGTLVDSCLLTPRGRTIDRIAVSLFPGSGPNDNGDDDDEDDDASSSSSTTEAYLLTSPGHGGSALFDRLEVDGRGVRPFLEGKLSNSFGLGDGDGGAATATKSDASHHTGTLVDSCLLTPRGRTIDRIAVSLFPGAGPNDNGDDDDEDDDASSSSSTTEAYLLTSPGHGGSALFDRLDPYVFPMDGVKLTDMMDTSRTTTRILAVAATRLSHVTETVQRYVLPHVATAADSDSSSAREVVLPRRGECTRIKVDGGTGGTTTDVIILPATFLPACVCVGYTLVISEETGDGGTTTTGRRGGGTTTTGQRIWEALTAEFDDGAPVELGPLEWETLRIEGGWPAYGREMTGDADDPKNEQKDTTTADGGSPIGGGVGAKASPLELHLESAVDGTKGCYLGQEAVSALLKNKRGIPRSLYSVVFHDDDNANNGSGSSAVGGLDDGVMDLASLLGASRDDGDGVDGAEVETRQPLSGDDLYVLGSAGKIKAGMITSVAEPGGSGDPTTLCLALIRRSDAILSKMESMGLELGGGNDVGGQGPDLSSPPPPVDPLDGLEVIIAGTNAIGKLQSLPCRRFRNGLNMFDAEVEAFSEVERDGGAVMGIVDSSRADASEFVPEGWDAVADDENENVEEEELRRAEEEAAKAAAEAEAAAAEAKRKAEKMEKLKRKAEEAMARRRKKKKKDISE